jgi:hypothetical protein
MWPVPIKSYVKCTVHGVGAHSVGMCEVDMHDVDIRGVGVQSTGKHVPNETMQKTLFL